MANANSNVKFHHPQFPKQCLANGFLFGRCNLDNNTISCNESILPISISDRARAKAASKKLSLNTSQFYSVYPKTLASGQLTIEISTVFYPHEFTSELVGKFRIRGSIVFLENELVMVEIKRRRNPCEYLEIYNPSLRLRMGEFWEFRCDLQDRRLSVTSGTQID